MTKLLTFAILAAGLCLATLGPAEARTIAHAGSITGPRGTTTFAGERTCSGGSCSSSGSVTGPNGKTASRTGSTSCANGTCSSTATVTGPNGASATRNGSTTVTHQ